MTLHAATATADVPGWLTLAGLALVLAALVYAASCIVFPFGRCWCCSGDGKHHRKDRKVHRRCRWCKGTGARLRIGRRMWNAARRLHREAG